uniref:Uncharacterized protein n=1 Tax=Manihot esculenta TaxID=3983 RepID=A0A2C9W031_MANES
MVLWRSWLLCPELLRESIKLPPKYLLVLLLAVVLLTTHSLTQYKPPINKPPPAKRYASVDPTDKHHGLPKKWPPNSIDGSIGAIGTEDVTHRPPAKKKPPLYSHRPPSSD